MVQLCEEPSHKRFLMLLLSWWHLCAEPSHKRFLMLLLSWYIFVRNQVTRDFLCYDYHGTSLGGTKGDKRFLMLLLSCVHQCEQSKSQGNAYAYYYHCTSLLMNQVWWKISYATTIMVHLLWGTKSQEIAYATTIMVHLCEEPSQIKISYATIIKKKLCESPTYKRFLMLLLSWYHHCESPSNNRFNMLRLSWYSLCWGTKSQRSISCATYYHGTSLWGTKSSRNFLCYCYHGTTMWSTKSQEISYATTIMVHLCEESSHKRFLMLLLSWYIFKWGTKSQMRFLMLLLSWYIFVRNQVTGDCLCYYYHGSFVVRNQVTSDFLCYYYHGTSLWGIKVTRDFLRLLLTSFPSLVFIFLVMNWNSNSRQLNRNNTHAQKYVAYTWVRTTLGLIRRSRSTSCPGQLTSAVAVVCCG